MLFPQTKKAYKIGRYCGSWISLPRDTEVFTLLSLVQEDSVSESSSDAGLGSEPESETTTIGKRQCTLKKHTV